MKRLAKIENGVVKINYSTQMKQATNDAIKNFIEAGELFNEIAFEKAIHDHVKPLLSLLTKMQGLALAITPNGFLRKTVFVKILDY